MDSGKNQEIFDHICELVTNAEFNEAQNDFFEVNCQKFQDDDENPHEYKQIYEEFLLIIERYIESKVKEDHGVTDDQLNAFYEDFKTNFKGYQEQNSDVVDTLFGILDFFKFKGQMLDMKKGMIDKNAAERAKDKDEDAAIEASGNQDFEALFWKIFNQDYTNKKGEWKKKLDKSNLAKEGWTLQIHQKKNAGSKVDMIRMDSQLTGVKMDDVINYWIDPPVEKMKMLREAREIEKIDDNTWIKYWRFKMPLISDRDCAFKIQKKNMPDGGQLVFVNTITHDDVPEVKGVVRMTMMVHGYVRPNKDDPSILDYTELDHFDMKGNMPPRLLNMTIASESQKEFKAMYKHLTGK